VRSAVAVVDRLRELPCKAAFTGLGATSTARADQALISQPPLLDVARFVLIWIRCSPGAGPGRVADRHLPGFDGPQPFRRFRINGWMTRLRLGGRAVWNASRGPVRLLTHLRYAGFVFNPVFVFSFAIIRPEDQQRSTSLQKSITPLVSGTAICWNPGLRHRLKGERVRKTFQCFKIIGNGIGVISGRLRWRTKRSTVLMRIDAEDI
jgi:hypothetical protein